MAFDYDPTDKGEFSKPATGVPTEVIIGQCESKTSSSGNKMIVLNCMVAENEEGAGYKFKEYLVNGVNWKIRQLLRACGLDPEVKHNIDDIFFRDRHALVIFKAEDWINDENETKTSYKPKEWVEPENETKKTPVDIEPEPVDEDTIPF